MRVSLPYGDGALDVGLPDHTRVLPPPTLTPLADPAAALHAAIAQPHTDETNAATFADRITADDHVVIAVGDLLHPAVTAPAIAAVLAGIRAQGVPDHRIQIVLGTGLHPAPSPARVAEIVGEMVLADLPVLLHDAEDWDALIFQRRYPAQRRGGVYLHAAYQRASVRILIGVTAPHLFMGFTGGGQAVLPGIAAAHNIRANRRADHLLRATIGVGPGNPVFDEMRDLAVASGVTWSVEATVDGAGHPTAWFAGDLAAAHDAAIAACRGERLRAIERPYDIVVVSGGGGAGDATLHQALPALATARRAVRDGGAIVLAAACGGGVGGAAYAELIASQPTPQALLETIVESEAPLAGQWGAQSQAMVQLHADTHLHSTLDATAARRAHFTPVEDLETTIADLASQYGAASGASPTILALPGGPGLIPVLPGDAPVDTG